MEYSVNYELIKGYYDNKLWGIDRIWNVVGKSAGVTEAEYKEITSFAYPNKS
jgi:hypothetical protein